MNNSKEKSFYTKFIESSYIGVSLVTFTFLSNHPFDYLKTYRQANVTNNMSNKTLVSKIYSLHGIRGFYTGGKANFLRALLKEAYRNPVRGIIKSFYAESIPKSIQRKFPEIRNVATGVSMASFDTFILCPLERIKVWVMTTEKNKKIVSYFKENNFSMGNLFKGIKISFVRSAASWISYLVIEEDIRKYVTKENLDKNNVSISQQILIGFLAGFVNCVFTLPFDSVKTQIQKCGSDKQNIVSTFKSILNTSGINGLYAGFFFRLPSYIIVALITSNNIQKIDKIWNVKE